MAHRLPFAPLLEQNDCHFAQSKDSLPDAQFRRGVMISCNTRSNAVTNAIGKINGVARECIHSA